MAEIVNLNRFRKERERAQKRAEADANAAKHGRTRVEKLLETLRADKAARNLDGHQREHPPALTPTPITLPAPPPLSDSASTATPASDTPPRPPRKPKA